MENIREIRARHENSRRLALACAKALEGLEDFLGTPSVYKVYLQVPVNFLGECEDWSETGSVDLLVCRAKDGLAALAVVFDLDGDRPRIPERLAAMNIRRFELTGELDDAKLAAAADAVCKAAELPVDVRNICGPVKLDTRSLKLVLSRFQIPMPQADTLVRGQIL